MSRLGKIPIQLPQGTEAKIDTGLITVKGAKGELKQEFPDFISMKVENNAIEIGILSKAEQKSKEEKAMWGLYWSLVRNMVTGVSVGYKKELEVIGVGFRVSVIGSKVNLNLGFSHPVEFTLPEGVTGQAQGNLITLESRDKQLLGETAAKIRRIKKPEPYKGKGIKYKDEVIRRKEGKTAGKGDK